VIDRIIKFHCQVNSFIVFCFFRKFFINQCDDSPMKSLRVDVLSDHDIGTKKHNLRIKVSVLFEEYMKAVDSLTIDPT
jgi:hypothetical protein